MPQILFADDPDLRLGFGFAENMLARGIYMHPWHNMFLCTAMSEDDIDFALTAAGAAFADLAAGRATLKPHPVVSAMMKSRAAHA